MKDWNLRKVTKWLVIITGIVWASYDFIPALFTDAKGDTISETGRDSYAFSEMWFIPYILFGILAHIFWYTNKDIVQRVPRRIAFFIVSALSVVLNLTLLRVDIPPYIIIPLGTLTGRLLWPQKARDEQAR